MVLGTCILGTWRVVFGTWYMVYVHGTWYILDLRLDIRSPCDDRKYPCEDLDYHVMKCPRVYLDASSWDLKSVSTFPTTQSHEYEGFTYGFAMHAALHDALRQAMLNSKSDRRLAFC